MSGAWRKKNTACLLRFSVISVVQLMRIEMCILYLYYSRKARLKNGYVRFLEWLSSSSGFLTPEGVSFSLAFFNYILALNPFLYLLQTMLILLLCLATALGCKTHFWAVSIHQNGLKIRHFCLGHLSELLVSRKSGATQKHRLWQEHEVDVDGKGGSGAAPFQ